jgi:SAM-dependent methyltransferase
LYEAAFASLYDRLMEDVDYPAWAAHYAELFREAGLDPVSVMDCACGTGNMTLALYDRGYRMIGSDRSVEMLSAAAEKARSRGIMIPFVRQDLRAIAAHRPMDAIVCACDGVNYLLSDADARRFFLSALGALRPGGGLFFDVSSARKLERTLGGNCFGDDLDDAAFLWRNEYDAARRVLLMRLTFFTRGPDGRYAAARETHVQRAHDADRLAALLRECGYKKVRAFGGMSVNPPSPDDERIHFIAVRED